ncbi:MAG: substrate-binding domain-containing protein [Treponema sp.]|jgi:phosphate transport system substrate-binding protein|nr:substrate-binding domain-containing protein [Treponema sp.]
MKETLSVFLALLTAGAVFANGRGETNSFDPQKNINVVSREDGSGTRGAFIELFGIEQRGADGSRNDMTTKEAVIARQTDVMMLNIAGDKYAIGYISLGSLNSTVKAVSIDGVSPRTDLVASGAYTVARPFYIVTKGEATGIVQDFIRFITSAEGQAVVGQNYIPVYTDADSYAGTARSGTIIVAGSSSVTPVMEKLSEAYRALNPSVGIEIQQSDSSTGITATVRGICDIGMVSRDLRESELAQLNPTKIAIDGIAVIVHGQNPVEDLTKDQVKAIFTGETVQWNRVIK